MDTAMNTTMNTAPGAKGKRSKQYCIVVRTHLVGKADGLHIDSSDDECTNIVFSCRHPAVIRSQPLCLSLVLVASWCLRHPGAGNLRRAG